MLLRPVTLPSTASGWRYVAEGRRDLRLDWLRGLCLAKMVYTHLLPGPMQDWQRWLGWVTAAEGFFFISGVVVGLVYRRRLEQQGLQSVTRQLWLRAGQLYVANLVLVIAFVLLEAAGVLSDGKFAWRWEGDWAWWRVFAFDHPYFLQVLPRYSVYLLAAPAALWLLSRSRRGGAVTVLGISTVIWFLNSLPGRPLLLPYFESGRLGFLAASWQLLFFVGLTLGWLYNEVARRAQRVSALPVLVLAALASAGFIVLQNAIAAGSVSLPRQNWLIGREWLGPLRLVNLAVFFTFAFYLVHLAWRPLNRATGWLLLPMGQASLYVFLVHIPIVALAEELDVARLGAISPWLLVPINVGVLLLICWMVRRRVLFGVIPR